MISGADELPCRRAVSRFAMCVMGYSARLRTSALALVESKPVPLPNFVDVVGPPIYAARAGRNSRCLNACAKPSFRGRTPCRAPVPRHAPRSLRIRIATEARSIARIGSKRKVLNVIRELEKQGIARKGLSANRRPWRWTSVAIFPEKIAIFVTAEMIAVRRNPDPIGALSRSRSRASVWYSVEHRRTP